MAREGFELAQNLNLGLVRYSCAVIMTTTQGFHCIDKILTEISDFLKMTEPLEALTYQRPENTKIM